MSRLSFFAFFAVAREPVSEKQSLLLAFALPQRAAAVVAPQWRQLGVGAPRPVAAVELLPPLGVDALGLLVTVARGCGRLVIRSVSAKQRPRRNNHERPNSR
jgi:hypothetical protein